MDDLDLLSELAKDWYRYLRAANVAHSTVGNYRKAVDRFIDEVGDVNPKKVTRRVLTRYFSEIAETPSKRRPGQLISAATVSNYYRALQQFWKWLHEVEQEIPENPFDKLKPPAIPERPVPVFSDEELKRLIDTCSGTRFTDRRDSAIVRVLLDTGIRVSELVGIQIPDLAFEKGAITVLGKGRKYRQVSIGDRTAEALRRYLRARKRHPKAEGSEALWIGSQGALTTWGVRIILDKRGREAQISNCNPHRFRHTFAHTWLAYGGQETDLMRLAGWNSRQMLSRYGASAASERALLAHQRARLGDRV